MTELKLITAANSGWDPSSAPHSFLTAPHSFLLSPSHSPRAFRVAPQTSPAALKRITLIEGRAEEPCP
jgi:hypothetical protein